MSGQFDDAEDDCTEPVALFKETQAPGANATTNVSQKSRHKRVF